MHRKFPISEVTLWCRIPTHHRKGSAGRPSSSWRVPPRRDSKHREVARSIRRNIFLNPERKLVKIQRILRKIRCQFGETSITFLQRRHHHTWRGLPEDRAWRGWWDISKCRRRHQPCRRYRLTTAQEPSWWDWELLYRPVFKQRHLWLIHRAFQKEANDECENASNLLPRVDHSICHHSAFRLDWTSRFLAGVTST